MYCIVSTALQARCINYLFPFLFPNLNFHYMYYMLTFGVQLLFILLMDSDITLLLLMTILNSIGCIYLNTNLMLFLHSNNSKQWQKSIIILPFIFLELTVRKSLPPMHSIPFVLILASFIISHAPTLHSKMELQRESIDTCQCTLALLSQSGLSLSYWSYALAIAIHLINKLPTPLLNMSSRWEQLHTV